MSNVSSEVPDHGVSEADASSLLIAAREDPDAFALLWRRFHPEVLAYFRRRTFDPEIAADLCAETFARVLLQLRRFDPDRGRGEAFLFALAQQELVRWRRRREVSDRAQRKVGMRLMPDHLTDFERVVDVVDATVLRADLHAALGALSVRDREVVRLRIVDGCSYQEIAAALGVTIPAARTRASRALARLTANLDAQVAGGVA